MGYLYVAFVVILGPYLVGSIPFGVLIGSLKGVDPRTVGSGNIGATNVWRALGPSAAITVLLLDALKGVLPVWFAGVMSSWVLIHLDKLPSFRPSTGDWTMIAEAQAIAALAAIVGHNWPVFLKFKGGKGVATGIGVLLAMDWRVALAVFATFLLVFLIWRYVSLASIVSATSVPLWFMWLESGKPALAPFVTFGVIVAFFIDYKHKANFLRLRTGTEPKFGKPTPAR